MGLFDRFFGKRGDDDTNREPLVANPAIQEPLGLQVLFPEARTLDAAQLTRALRKIDRSLRDARCEIDDELSREGLPFGLAGWGKHVIRLVGFNAPMPGSALELCVAPAHYPAELKAQARAHRAYVILYYAGFESSPLEQYVALTIMASVFGQHGALVVANEYARTSLPMTFLNDISTSGKAVEMLRELPLPYLFCGFVKYEVEDVRGVWMRTYGAKQLGLPDLAAHAAGHQEAQRYFDMFDSVFRYVLSSGTRLGRGHTMQIGAHEYMRARAPKLSESFLVPNGELFVLEVIGPNEVNR